MISHIRRCWFRLRLFAWRCHRRANAHELSEHVIFSDGPLRVSFLCAWGPFKSEYIVWRQCPRIGRARIYGKQLLFGQAAEVIRQQTFDSQLDARRVISWAGKRNGRAINRL